MQLVKLGGSIITQKGGAKRVQHATLARLAKECASLAGDGVVLHGAGSFGHTLAKKAKLKGGITKPAQADAASLVSADVRALHVEVLRALHAAKCRPFSMPAGQVAWASAGGLQGIALAPFKLALAQGFTPVSCGDVVLDDEQGIAIISADTVALYLGASLEADRAVFATDVDGIFTAPPGTRGATLIEECTPDELREQTLGGSGKTDVTGGMALKGQAIAAMAELGCEVWVVNGTKPGRLRAALEGKSPTGTLVRIR